MTSRKTLKIRRPTADRFERFCRDRETQTAALSRLLDQAGVPEAVICDECGETASGIFVKTRNGDSFCGDCSDIDRSMIP